MHFKDLGFLVDMTPEVMGRSSLNAYEIRSWPKKKVIFFSILDKNKSQIVGKTLPQVGSVLYECYLVNIGFSLGSSEQYSNISFVLLCYFVFTLT